MKLRIKGASIRLRLTRGEVSDFAGSGLVKSATPFGPRQPFTYTLMASDQADTLTASFDGEGLSVVVPAAAARRWAMTDEVGIEGEQPAGSEVLHILIEKDFQCLHRDDARRDPDAYPHPMQDALPGR